MSDTERQSPSIACIPIRVCGFDKGITLQLFQKKQNAREIRQMEKEILQDFNADSDHYFVLWHLKDEGCYVRRPLSEMSESMDGKHIQLHLFRFDGAEEELNAMVERAKGAKEVDGSAGKAKFSAATSKERRKDEQPETQGAVGGGRSIRGSSNAKKLDGVGTSSGQASQHGVLRVRVTSSDNTRRQLRIGESADSLLEMRLDASTNDLLERIRQALVSFLEGSPEARELVRNATDVPWRTVVDTDGQGAQALDLNDRLFGGRFSAVSDLMEEPATADATMTARISLIEDGFDAHGTPTNKRNEPPASGSNSLGSPVKKHRSLAPKPAAMAVDIDQVVRHFQDSDSHDYLRLGEGRERLQANDDDVAAEWPIVAEIEPAEKQLIQLWQTEGWDFNDRCLGGFDIGKKSIGFARKHTWFGGYQGVKSRKGLQERIVQLVPGDPRYPSLPSMTFNTFDPAAYTPPMGSMKIQPDTTVAVVVRFVSHLSGLKAKGSVFHDNLQFMCTDRYAFKQVKDDILAELGAEEEKTVALFRQPLKDTWELQLWVLPHEPAPQKLFRFDGSKAKLLKHFVSQQALDKNHRKLYMEAHLWPVSAESMPESAVSGAPKDNDVDCDEGRSRPKRKLQNQAGKNSNLTSSSGTKGRAQAGKDGGDNGLYDEKGLHDSTDEEDQEAAIQQSLATYNEEQLARTLVASVEHCNTDHQRMMDEDAAEAEAYARGVEASIQQVADAKAEEAKRLGQEAMSAADFVDEEQVELDDDDLADMKEMENVPATLKLEREFLERSGVVRAA